MVLAVLVPVVVAVAILVNVLGDDDRDGGSAAPGPAEIEGSAPPERADLPPLPVAVPPPPPERDEPCTAVLGAVPLELAGQQSRPVQSDSAFVYAWGEPPVVLVCGVDRPAGWTVEASAIQINGVQWYVDTSDPDTTVWTAVDRPVYVEVRLPASVDSAPVTALTTPLAQALPYQEPTPAE